MKNIQNKWIRAAIPALLLHCSIGTVYCWSLVSDAIATELGTQKSVVEWAFSLAIFFLGMSAAFLGPFVEKDIHRSSLVAAICFSAGMADSLSPRNPSWESLSPTVSSWESVWEQDISPRSRH